MVKKDKTSPDNAKSSIWGGRFSSGPSKLMTDINASISYDRRLYRQDIAGSKAHASMLAARKIITDADCKAIHQGLDRIIEEIEGGSFVFSEALEDIHMNVESRLAELVGEPAASSYGAHAMIKLPLISNYGYVIYWTQLI